MTIKEKLQLIKKLTGLSQEKLAQKLNVSFPTFNSWINGKSIPHRSKQLKINELYEDVSDKELMKEPVPPAVKKILKKKPWITWSTTKKENISLPTAVYSILSYGDLNDVKKLMKETGVKKVKRIFEKQLKGRTNYSQQTINFFSLYFKKHVSSHTG